MKLQSLPIWNSEIFACINRRGLDLMAKRGFNYNYVREWALLTPLTAPTMAPIWGRIPALTLPFDACWELASPKARPVF